MQQKIRKIGTLPVGATFQSASFSTIKGEVLDQEEHSTTQVKFTHGEYPTGTHHVSNHMEVYWIEGTSDEIVVVDGVLRRVPDSMDVDTAIRKLAKKGKVAFRF